jgi:hypothetical protein
LFFDLQGAQMPYRILFFLGALVLSLKGLEALYPFSHGDALNYHLVGPRFIFETSWFELNNDFWGNHQSGIFEFIYLLTIGTFGNTLLGQTSSQLLHFSLGLLTAAVSMFVFFRLKNPTMAICSLIATLTISRGGDFFLYAKSDGAVASFSLICFLLLYHDKTFEKIKNSKKFLILYALLLGLVPAFKLSGLFTMIPLAIYAMIRFRFSWKPIVTAAFIALIPLSFVLIRNWYYMRSPFFPGLLGVFPGYLSPTMLKYYQGVLTTTVNLESFFKIMTLFFTGKVIFLSIPVFAFLNFRNKRSELNIPLYLSFATLVLYMVMNGGVTDERFYFTCFFFNLFFVLNSLAQYRFHPKWIALVVVLVLVDSKLDKSLKRIKKLPSVYSENESKVLDQYIPLSRVWRIIPRVETKEKIWVISDHFAQQFYSPPLYRLDQYQSHPRTDFLGQCQESDIVKLRPYRFAILKEIKDNPCYDYIFQRGKLLGEVDIYKVYELPSEIKI